MTINTIRSMAYAHDNYLPATRKQVTVINILLSEYSANRIERLILLETWLGRPFTSSKELMLGEASAIINCGYTDGWEHNPEFVTFIKETLDDYNRF